MPRERIALAHTRHSRRGRPIFLWEDAKPEWPRRLLHIPTMTSVERQPGNLYGPRHEKEPNYSILTYTWGRWPAPGGPHIPVRGTSWAIPAVDEARFTVAAFEAVIRKMGQASDFAWIDVVCIDQEDYDVKMDEIGRQVGIFANASQVYVWLWSLPTARLQDVYDDITRCGASLEALDGSFRPLPPPASSSAMYDDTVPREAAQEGNSGSLEQIPHATIASLEASVQTLLGDPWFSSLWTLQEGLLRQDAIFLSAEAEYIEHRVKIASPEAELVSLTRAFSTIRQALESYNEQSIAPSYGKLVDSVVKAIKKSGYPAKPLANNPNIQWAAAQSRNATNPEDRIYGIMALYNVRVGDAVPKAGQRNKPSLSELETEFAVTLNAKSPLLGQLFVHVGPSRPRGNSWEISRDITVPEEFAHWLEKQYFDYCTITGTSAGSATFKGPVCYLKDLRRLWDASVRRKEAYSVQYSFNVVLDEYIVNGHPGIVTTPANRKADPADRTKAVFTLIDTTLHEFGVDAVSVLELGGWTRDVYGLLLLHPPGERSKAKRIGICRWDRNEVAKLAEPVRAIPCEGVIE